MITHDFGGIEYELPMSPANPANPASPANPAYPSRKTRADYAVSPLLLDVEYRLYEITSPVCGDTLARVRSEFPSWVK